jgi:DNA-binding transcriptional LysR family regulator
VGKVDWDKQIGRRVRWQALHVFRAVAELGSLSQAARHFGCSQPAVSGAIAELEHALGVKLLDRSARGVEPNVYGRTLLRRCAVAFDEVKQGINDIEALAGSAVGELRIGCTEAVATAILQPIIERFSTKYSDVVLRVHYADSLIPQLPQLRNRNIDICLARWRKLPVADGDLDVEVLFNDETVVAASKRSRWARSARIELDELASESWILTPPDSWNYSVVAEAFRRRGLFMPKPFLMTFSVPLRVNLVASGNHITALPASILRFNPDNFGLATLPIELPPQEWPVAIVTLKNRTLSTPAQLFCDHVRAFTRSLAEQAAVATRCDATRSDPAVARSFWL